VLSNTSSTVTLSLTENIHLSRRKQT